MRVSSLSSCFEDFAAACVFKPFILVLPLHLQRCSMVCLSFAIAEMVLILVVSHHFLHLDFIVTLVSESPYGALMERLWNLYEALREFLWRPYGTLMEPPQAVFNEGLHTGSIRAP